MSTDSAPPQAEAPPPLQGGLQGALDRLAAAVDRLDAAADALTARDGAREERRRQDVAALRARLDQAIGRLVDVLEDEA